MQVLNLINPREWQFKYFLRYLAVINFNFCCIHDFETIAFYAEIPVEDVKFIHDNFHQILQKYKHRKELDIFCW